MTPRTLQTRAQTGFSLIEVLVAILLLSIGLLSLSAMLSFAVQSPKLSGYRSAAVNLASGHIERMRANADGFASGAYDRASSYDGLHSPLELAASDRCAYPACTMGTLARMDVAELRRAARAELPAGGVYMLRASKDGVPSNTDGNLWVVWQEPISYALLNAAASDSCPEAISASAADPQPRCIYVRFRL